MTGLNVIDSPGEETVKSLMAYDSDKPNLRKNDASLHQHSCTRIIHAASARHEDGFQYPLKRKQAPIFCLPAWGGADM